MPWRLTACRGHRSQNSSSGFSNLLTSPLDRKSTRLNSSHSQISYAVFCLKKKKTYVAPALAADGSQRAATVSVSPYTLSSATTAPQPLAPSPTLLLITHLLNPSERAHDL